MTAGESTAALVQSALDRVLAAKTAVQAVLLGADDIPAMTELDDAKRLLLRARTRAAGGASPDIVSGEQARELPPGSLVVLADEHGRARPEHRVREVGAVHMADYADYLVLHRAPMIAPKVGDVVTNVEGLDALPVGSVVRLNEHQGLVGTKHESGHFVVNGVLSNLWYCLAPGLRVLDLGEPPEGASS